MTSADQTAAAGETELRDAGAVDAPAVHQVITRSFEEYRGRLEPPSGAHTETTQSIGALIEREHCIVAQREGRVVGCVFYVLQPARDGDGQALYLHRLAVLPEARRERIGSLLVAAVEARAQVLGAAWVCLGVRLALLGNRRFYERLGYRLWAFGSHPGYSRPTYMTMRKRIGAAGTLTGGGPVSG